MNIPQINGIPAFGLGTWPLKGAELADAIAMAFELGIRHVDTAQMYGNERDVGKAVAECRLPRGELYVVTKVEPGNLGAQRFAPSVAQSVKDLGGPPDLLLIHWPPPNAEIEATVERLVEEKRKGNARAIGVSNFSPGMMRRAQAVAEGELVCNQVEFHPLLDQGALLAGARELGMALTAYSPLGRGKAIGAHAVQDIARRLSRPASAVVLRWIIQQGVVAIPKTAKRANMEANLQALNFTLTDEDMATITALGTR